MKFCSFVFRLAPRYQFSPLLSLAVFRPTPCFLCQYSPPPLRRHLPTLRILPFSLGLGAFLSPFSLYNHLFFTYYIVLSNVFLPSLSAHRRIVSFRLTLKFSLSLTKAPSFHHAPFVGRILIPLASLCFRLALSFSRSSSRLKLLPPISSKYLAETSLSDRLYPSSVFFSFACLLLSFFGKYQPPHHLHDYSRSSPILSLKRDRHARQNGGKRQPTKFENFLPLLAFLPLVPPQ